MVSGHLQEIRLDWAQRRSTYDSELADVVLMLRAPGPLCERNISGMNCRGWGVEEVLVAFGRERALKGAKFRSRDPPATISTSSTSFYK